MQVTGASAVVTGAASGLGAATSAALAAAGVHVVGFDLAAGWERAGDPAAGVTAVRGDVTSAVDVATAVAAAGERAPLRLAVNCAGIATAGRVLSRRGAHDLDVFARVVSVNLVGTFNVLRLAAEAIAATDPVDEQGQRGLIVNTASIAAFDGQVGQAAYAASKGGVAGMTLPAARDLAQFGIRVMTIAPGILDTPMLAGVHRGIPHRAGRHHPVSLAVRPTRGIRRAGAVDRGAGLPQRRGHPAGRIVTHAATLTSSSVAGVALPASRCRRRIAGVALPASHCRRRSRRRIAGVALPASHCRRRVAGSSCLGRSAHRLPGLGRGASPGRRPLLQLGHRG